MATFIVQLHWTRLNLSRCYLSFVEQFDNLHQREVVWEPYGLRTLQARAPHLGLSAMCFRDQSFWLTKEKLVFDVYVHDNSPQRS